MDSGVYSAPQTGKLMSWGQNIPPPSAPINYEHPLMQGCIGLWVGAHAGSVLYDRSRYQNPISIQSYDAPKGGGLWIPRSADCNVRSGMIPAYSTLTGTMVVRVRGDGVRSGVNDVLFSNGNWNGMMIYDRPSSGDCAVTAFENAGNNDRLVSDAYIGGNGLYHIVTTFSPTDYRMYVNGRYCAYAATKSWAAGDMGFGLSSPQGGIWGSYSGIYEKAMVSNRVWSHGDVLLDYAEPWDMFDDPDDEVWYSIPGGTGTAWARALSESFYLNDGRIFQASRVAQESIALSDTRIITAGKRANEGFTVTDNRSSSAGKKATETVSVTDVATKASGKKLSESVTIADTRTITAARKIAEAFGVTDAVLASLAGVLAKLLTETVIITDTRKMIAGVIRAESITITDTLSKAAIRRISEIIPLLDTRTIALARIIGESLGVSDALAVTAGVATLITVLAGGRGAGVRFGRGRASDIFGGGIFDTPTGQPDNDTTTGGNTDNTGGNGA